MYFLIGDEKKETMDTADEGKDIASTMEHTESPEDEGIEKEDEEPDEEFDLAMKNMEDFLVVDAVEEDPEGKGNPL